MTAAGSALYLDFDNVFSGLMQLDPEVAFRWAEQPARWLATLKHTHTVDHPRRWLVLRCYLNPAGVVPPWHPNQAKAGVPFSQFRQAFVRAGFDVVDCPRVVGRKNSADIRMVIDAVDSLGAKVRYGEYVIASGDSDMGPLLVRLRADDRRTTVISSVAAASGYGAAADRFIDGAQLLDLVRNDPASSLGTPEEPLPTPTPPIPAQFRSMVVKRYRASAGPLHLATLGQELRREFGESIDATKWFGFGTCTRAIRSLQLPGAELAGVHLWDTRRHPAPAAVSAGRG